MKSLSLHFIINNMHAPNGLITDVNTAINAGVHVVHYSDKKLRKRQIVENAYILSALCKKNDVLFIMQDYPDIAGLVGADGVHLTDRSFSIDHVRRILGPDKIIGADFTSLKDAVEAEDSGVDYVCFNIGDFNNKTTIKSILTKIQKLKEIMTIPIIARGNLSIEGIQELMNKGIDGVALLSLDTQECDMCTNIKQVLAILTPAFSE